MATRLLRVTPPLAIAHRGGAKLCPENTLAAFAHACTFGVDALECDVRLARDGEPVLVHDATLDRTTDVTGPVDAWTADELACADAGYHFGPDQGFPFRGRGLGVPRLSDLLKQAPNLPLIVEIKGDDANVVGPVLEVIRATGAMGRVMLAGFSQIVVTRVRSEAPALLTSASRAEVLSALGWAWIRVGPRRPPFRLVQAPLELQGRQVLTRSFVRVLRRAGLPVQAWIVDEVEDMHRLLDWGVTGIISDRPDRAASVVRARSAVVRS